MTEAPLPLADLRVLDLSDQIAGAYLGRVLADAGADVIKVEDPGGSVLRRRAPARDPESERADSALFRYLHGGMQSWLLDDVTQLHALIGGADLIVWDGVGAGSRAVDVERCRSLAPHAVVVALTAYGLDGPWRHRAGDQFVDQAWAGVIAYRGDPDRLPVAIGGELPEWFHGACGAAAGLGALRRARRDGVGELVDVSRLEATAHLSILGPVTYLEMFGYPTHGDRAVTVPDIHPTRDGHVGFRILTASQWAAFCALIGRTDWAADETLARLKVRRERHRELATPIDDWTRRRTTDEVLRLADELRVPAAPVTDGRSVLEVPHVRQEGLVRESPYGFVQPAPAIGFRSGARTAQAGLSPEPGRAEPRWQAAGITAGPPAEAGDTEPGLPLNGIRVADFTMFWAGPVAGQWLAALGADVIHVESIQRPDAMRLNTARPMTDPHWPEWSAYFHAANHGKRAITLDMSREDGRRLAEELIAQCDVLLENYSPRVFESWGLTPQRLRQINPRLVTVRLPGYGLSGPWRDRGAYASTIEMASGLAARTGYPDGPPTAPGAACDPVAGTHGAIGALLGLAARDLTGQGVTSVVPMIGSALACAAEQIVDYSAYGTPTTRIGNRSTRAAPQGIFRTADGPPIALSVRSDEDWHRLQAALGHPGWASGHQLAEAAGRLAHQELIEAQLTVWVAVRSADEVAERLTAHDVPVGQVLFPHQQLEVEQLVARDFFAVAQHPVTGATTYARLPFVLERGPSSSDRRAAPCLGQHNREVLCGLLGVSSADFERLQDAAVIGSAAVSGSAPI